VNHPSPDIQQLRALSRNELVAALYRGYGRKLYSYAVMSWKLNEDAAWELVYKTIYKVADSFHNYTFETTQKLQSFLFKAFINYLRNYYRDHKHEQQQAFTAMEDVDLGGMQAESPAESPASQKLQALNEVLETMEEWERTLLLMRSQGYAYAEIAAYVNKPENQLKVYYQRLKEQVIKKLHEGK